MDREEQFTGAVSAASPLAMVTISCGLGERRTMQMALNISAADEPDIQNEMLDRAMRIMDRQQARYDLDGKEANFKQVGLNTRNMIAGMAVAKSVVDNQIASLTAQLEGKTEAREALWSEGYDAHVKSGRAGAYKPKGFEDQRLKVAESEIAKLRSALEAAPNDAERERANLVTSIQRNQFDLKERRKEINGLRAMAGLELNTEFSEEENKQV